MPCFVDEPTGNDGRSCEEDEAQMCVQNCAAYDQCFRDPNATQLHVSIRAWSGDIDWQNEQSWSENNQMIFANEGWMLAFRQGVQWTHGLEYWSDIDYLEIYPTESDLV